MAKRNWPNHPGVGREITVDGVSVKVVDVKVGPVTGDVHAALNGGELDIRGSLKLKVKYPNGTERWLPPVDGDAFCNWCTKQGAVAQVQP